MEEFKGIKIVADSKSTKKKVLTPKIRDEKDEIVTSRKGIANTFAKFYDKLHAKGKHDEDEGIHDEETTNSNKELDVSEDHTKKERKP